MKTKIFILLLTIPFIFSNGQSKEVKDSINDKFVKMITHFSNQEFDLFLEYMHPSVYEFVSEDATKQALLQMIDNEDFSVEYDKKIPKLKYSEIQTINKNTFIFINHQSIFYFDYKKEVEDQDFWIEVFTAQGLNAEFLSNTRMKIIKENNYALGLKNKKSTNQWKFLNLDENKIYTKIIPTEIDKAFQEFKKTQANDN